MTRPQRDVLQLRELAANCRRLAATSADESDVALFRKTASEYDALANRIERAGIDATGDQLRPGK